MLSRGSVTVLLIYRLAITDYFSVDKLNNYCRVFLKQKWQITTYIDQEVKDDLKLTRYQDYNYLGVTFSRKDKYNKEIEKWVVQGKKLSPV